ncbi:MAG: DUF2442 domain-containing protein [Chlorobium sp.]
MMNHPKILSAIAIDDHSLLVEFDNHQKKTYDINPLLEDEMFAPLRNAALFRTVRVDVGGYAVVWRKDIDISENELWVHGKTIL